MYKERAHTQLLKDAVSWVSDLQWMVLGMRRDLEMKNRKREQWMEAPTCYKAAAYTVVLQQRVE